LGNLRSARTTGGEPPGREAGLVPGPAAGATATVTG